MMDIVGEEFNMRYLFLLFTLLLASQSAAFPSVINATTKQVLIVDAQNVLTLKRGAVVYIDKAEGNYVVYDLSQTWQNQVILNHNGKDIVLHDGQLLSIVNSGFVTIKARHSILSNTVDNIYTGHFALHSLFSNEPEVMNVLKTNSRLSSVLVKAAVMQGEMRGEQVVIEDGPPINSEYPFVDLLSQGVLSEEDLPQSLHLAPGILASSTTVRLLVNNMPVTFHIPSNPSPPVVTDPNAAKIAILEAHIAKAQNREAILKSLIALDITQERTDRKINNADERQENKLTNEETKDSKAIAKLHATDATLHTTVHSLVVADAGLITDISNLNVTISQAQQAESTALIAINKDEAQIAPLSDDVTNLQAAIKSENSKTDKALIAQQKAQIKSDNAQIKVFQSDINSNQSIVNKNQTLVNQSNNKIATDQAKLTTDTAKIATDRATILANIKTIQADKMQERQNKAIIRADNRTIIKNTAQIAHDKTQVINDKARIQHIQSHITIIQHNINVLEH